jgi:hypothetical protein
MQKPKFRYYVNYKLIFKQNEEPFRGRTIITVKQKILGSGTQRQLYTYFQKKYLKCYCITIENFQLLNK